MNSFSERMGIKPIRVEVQRHSADNKLRNELWNIIYTVYFKNFSNPPIYRNDDSIRLLYSDLWMHFYGQGLDNLPYHVYEIKDLVKQTIMEADWNEMYELLEFIPNHYPNTDGQHPFNLFCDYSNKILEKHLSAYRFVDKHLSEVTSKEEIDTIEEALEKASALGPVKTHLNRALELYSDRLNPDYRNSIKESISSVEAYCKKLTGNSKATLGTTLAVIEKQHSIHGSLKSAFDKLYGYSSDAAGIRHALLDETDLKQEDAKFMLVTCSAFVNYLIVKSAS